MKMKADVHSGLISITPPSVANYTVPMVTLSISCRITQCLLVAKRLDSLYHLSNFRQHPLQIDSLFVRFTISSLFGNVMGVITSIFSMSPKSPLESLALRSHIIFSLFCKDLLLSILSIQSFAIALFRSTKGVILLAI